jgi:hypothetical protein
MPLPQPSGRHYCGVFLGDLLLLLYGLYNISKLLKIQIIIKKYSVVTSVKSKYIF